MTFTLYLEIAICVSLLMGVLCAWAIPTPTNVDFGGAVVLSLVLGILWPFALLFLGLVVPFALIFGFAALIRSFKSS